MITGHCRHYTYPLRTRAKTCAAGVAYASLAPGQERPLRILPCLYGPGSALNNSALPRLPGGLECSRMDPWTAEDERASVAELEAAAERGEAQVIRCRGFEP